MELKTSVNPQGQVYIPSKIRESIGMEPTKLVILIGNSKTLFLIPAKMTPQEALKSLEVIQFHLQHKMESQ